MQHGVLLHEAANDRDLQTRKRLARRAKSAVVARSAIAPPTVHALGNI